MAVCKMYYGNHRYLRNDALFSLDWKDFFSTALVYLQETLESGIYEFSLMTCLALIV